MSSVNVNPAVNSIMKETIQALFNYVRPMVQEEASLS